MTTLLLGRYRWLVCSLLFLATTINYIDRQILSLLKSTLDNELHWTNAEFGLVNSLFSGAYAIGLLLFGKFIDRFGVKLGYATSIVAWSLAAAGHALVGSVGGFKIARVALGLGEGGNFPSSIKAVALWFPKRERAFATALFNSGSNVGAIVAPAIVPVIAGAWGWRAAFVLMGVVGLLWLLVWLPFYDSPEKIARVTRDELLHIRSDAVAVDPNEGRPMGWIELLGYRQAWSFIVAKFMTDPVWWFFLIWLPDYFKKKWALDIKSSWVHLVTIYAIITVLSIAGSWFTGNLSKRGWSSNRARKTGMFVFACCVFPDLLRDARRSLDRGRADRHRRRGAPGVVGQPVHHHVGHVPQARGRVAGGYGWDGRVGGRDRLPAVRGRAARSPGNARICRAFRHLWLGLPAGVHRQPPAGAAV